jgi:hypothetical protein
VIIAILLGVRTGGIGLGLWGLVGLAVLVFGFGLAPGDPPTTSMLIILSVITAASTMQSVGGIDYLVEVAKKLLKKKPAYIALIAPLVAFIFTLGAARLHLLPVDPGDLRVALANNVRPNAPGSGEHGVAVRHHCQPGQCGDGNDGRPARSGRFGISDILIVVLPASISACSRPASSRCVGKELRTTRSTRKSGGR